MSERPPPPDNTPCEARVKRRRIHRAGDADQPADQPNRQHKVRALSRRHASAPQQNDHSASAPSDRRSHRGRPLLPTVQLLAKNLPLDISMKGIEQVPLPTAHHGISPRAPD